MRQRHATRLLRRARGGFTLIELLIVIGIIAILAGLTMSTMVYVNNKIGRGRTIWQLEQMKNAIAEFHSTYGIYPPANPSNAGRTGVDWEYRMSDPWQEPPGGRNYATGLVYYICRTDDPNYGKWGHYVEKFLPSTGIPIYSNKGGSGYSYWTNNLWTAKDPWERPYHYESYGPNYQSYRLWSDGPSTATTNDDIGTGWAE